MVYSVSGNIVIVYRCAEIKIERLMGNVSQPLLQVVRVTCKHHYSLDALNGWSD